MASTQGTATAEQSMNVIAAEDIGDRCSGAFNATAPSDGCLFRPGQKASMDEAEGHPHLIRG